MNDMEREAAVKQIAGIACAVNKVSIIGADKYFHIASSWQQDILLRIENNVEELTKTKGIPPALAKRALCYTRHYLNCLDDKKLFLTYADLHFDNLVMTENGRLFLLDYEMLEAAPCDFVLDVWQRMLIHPFIYANEDDHALTVPQDYRHILSWLQKYAPSLFSHPHVRERVNIYGILYELDILRDYPMGGWPIERLEIYLNGVAW
jgi:thiamine kinase-like enzyme